MTRVALVMTVLNEAAGLDELLASLDAQQRRPDQVVIVDGGSTDGTVERLLAWAARDPGCRRVRVEPGASISEGRNLAIAMADAPYVAVTDGGTRADPGWLAALVSTAERTGADVVAGYFVPVGRTLFERVLAAVITPRLAEIRPETFLPSSRSVLMTRAAWELGGRYPTWLDFCEDLVLDMRIKAAGGAFAFCPDAVVTWSARPDLASFFRQYYRYARGDGKAGIKARTHAVRYAVYLAGAGAVVLAVHQPLVWALLAVAGAAYLAPSVRRLLGAGTVRGARTVPALALVPVICVVGDVARMSGYPAGVIWRRRLLASQVDDDPTVLSHESPGVAPAWRATS